MQCILQWSLEKDKKGFYDYIMQRSLLKCVIKSLTVVREWVATKPKEKKCASETSHSQHFIIMLSINHIKRACKIRTTVKLVIHLLAAF